MIVNPPRKINLWLFSAFVGFPFHYISGGIFMGSSTAAAQLPWLLSQLVASLVSRSSSFHLLVTWPSGCHPIGYWTIRQSSYWLLDHKDFTLLVTGPSGFHPIGYWIIRLSYYWLWPSGCHPIGYWIIRPSSYWWLDLQAVTLLVTESSGCHPIGYWTIRVSSYWLQDHPGVILLVTGSSGGHPIGNWAWQPGPHVFNVL